MLLKIDVRETALIENIKQIIETVDPYKGVLFSVENLPLGDAIYSHNNEDRIVIERKNVADLLASIKDGRYEEQSYRLNGLNVHNHNIIYLIEGDLAKPIYRAAGTHGATTAYSALFSLNYYKGFSVMRTMNLRETAVLLCNIYYKMEKELDKKLPYYKNVVSVENDSLSFNDDVNKTMSSDVNAIENNEIETTITNVTANEKSYIDVIKRVKKDNITMQNIDEIMLCQIPNVSSITAIAIIKHYSSLFGLLKALEENPDCLKNLSTTNEKGQTRKISKTAIENIVKYLIKKEGV
jgi:ERCC4-type nuclease